MSATPKFSEERMVQIARNALLVAGHEMGSEGDHWPVIKLTIQDIMRTYEELKVERNVHAEMKKHLTHDLLQMEKALACCSQEEKDRTAPLLAELKEIYDAYFTDVDEHDTSVVEMPEHIKTAQEIVKTLEAGNE